MKRDKSRAAAVAAIPDATPRQPLPAELCQRLGFMLAKAHQEIMDRMARFTAPTGLTPRHFGMLVLIHRRGPMRQTDVADAVRVDRTTAMNLIDELEDAGFVKRGTDPSDRRANAVRATAKGAQWLEKLRPIAEDVEREFLAPLSVHEQQSLRDMLMRLVSTPVGVQ